MKSTVPFRVQVPIRFRHGDPAKISFFANVYPLAHDVFEDFVQALGFEWKMWFDSDQWGVPLRHSECDYFRPLMPGEICEIETFVERLGDTSLTMKYRFSSRGEKCCEVTLVHTFYDLQKQTKMTIPSLVRERLEAYRSQCLGS